MALTREWSQELTDKIMGHVRDKTAFSLNPPTCETFCKSLRLWEMRTNKNFKVEPYIKKVICTMIVAVLGSEEEGGRRSRSTVAINNALGPLIT